MNDEYNSIYYTVGSLSPEIALLVAAKAIGTVVKKGIKTTGKVIKIVSKPPKKLNGGKTIEGFDDKISKGAGVQSSGNQSWYKEDGSINYPHNNGALPGSEKTATLQPGQNLGRYGDIRDTSAFVTRAGDSADELSLPPNTNPNIYTEYTVIKPVSNVTQATVREWASSSGGGLQYGLPYSIPYSKKWDTL